MTCDVRILTGVSGACRASGEAGRPPEQVGPCEGASSPHVRSFGCWSSPGFRPFEREQLCDFSVVCILCA